MPTGSDDPLALQEFAALLGTRDPKTVATYLTTVCDFVAWLALQPGGTPFHLGLVTETAVRGYMDFLATTNRAPRPRSNTAQINAKYGPEPGLVFYTHISDQLDPYRTKVITGTPLSREYELDKDDR